MAYPQAGAQGSIVSIVYPGNVQWILARPYLKVKSLPKCTLTCWGQNCEPYNMNDILRSHLSREDYTLLQNRHHKSKRKQDRNETVLQEAFFFSFSEHVCLCVRPDAPQYLEETAAWVCVGWKGQSLQITSDFSDRKLGKNLRKLLSTPAQKKSKEEKNKFTHSALRKINTAFRCTSTITRVHASLHILLSPNMDIYTKGGVPTSWNEKTVKQSHDTKVCFFIYVLIQHFCSFWQTKLSINHLAAH